jgi:hypothetical protein
MEGKLARLMDYQKFEPNSKLDRLIQDVESRYSLDDMALSDDELGMINAAGNVNLMAERKKDDR